MAKAIVSVKFTQDHSNVRLRVSLSQDLSNPIYSSISATTNTIAKITIEGLLSDTQYYYGVMIGEVLQNQGRGKFKTFPSSAGNFTCAFGSCAPTGINHQVFETIQNLNPLFFIHMGDLHYENIWQNDLSLFRQAYDEVFSASRQANLYANVPTMYMWDDHDFADNDSWGAALSKPAAQSAYKERVPHYPLNTTDGGIGQSWVVGRVRFIMPDIMSYKTNPSNADVAGKTQFGETQLQWFFNELKKPEPVKIWVNTKPWIGQAETGDKWWGYTHERTRIADFIKANNLQYRVAIISGDMHGLAIDDGTNSDYATGGGGAIPVFQAAPLGSNGSIKGGGWSHGSFTNGTDGNQYGVMNVIDNGTTDNITVEWKGMRGTQEMVSHTMSIPSAPYEMDIIPPVVTASPNGGDFVESTAITLTANETADIFYTLDGSTPTVSSDKYTSPITITDTTTLRFFAVDTTGNASVAQSIVYTKLSSAVFPTTGLVLHLDAEASTKTIELGTSLVKQINDLSGNDNHAIGSVGREPTYDTTTREHPIIDFQGVPVSSTSNALTIEDFNANLTNEFTIISTLFHDGTVGGQILLELYDSSNTVIRALNIQGSTGLFRAVHGTNTPVGTPSWRLSEGEGVVSVVSSATELSLYLDGSLEGTEPTTTPELATISRLAIGGRFVANWDNYDGKMGEILIYNRALNTTELTNIHNYLLAKWN